jgi:ABC-type transporter Mla subunit MlaD
VSLGPPFDASGFRTQQRVGAGVVLLIGAAVAWVLLLSGRSIGRGVIFHVEVASAGALRTGARVMLAGRQIGEVRGASTIRTGEGVHVDFEVFVARAWAENVRRNSQLFVSSPSVLGEAYLEIGPPLGGAEPGPSVTDGDLLRGADPPDLDRFFVHAEASIREVLALLRDQRPDFDDLLKAGDSLLATLSGLPADKGQLKRIVDQGGAALDAGRGLFAAIRDAGGVDRIRKAAHGLAEIADRAGPDLSSLGERLERSIGRLEKLGDLVTPERRAEVAEAIERLRRVVTLGQKIATDIGSIEKKIRAGQGTIGALLADREIFDDLHETHRIIKSQPLRFLLKTVKPGEPIVK